VRSHRITGGGNIQLNVVEFGNARGHPILFIHGFSQSWLTWSRQLNSDLAADFLLVAIDLRGHGLSDKPRDAYADSRLWADDVNAVVKTLRLDHPILCSGVRAALRPSSADDAVVKPSVVDRHKAHMVHAQIHIMADTGHAPFWDDPVAFNRRLRAFAESL
jgi:pimeloyl-ACP methyl ester carboxylesterase